MWTRAAAGAQKMWVGCILEPRLSPRFFPRLRNNLHGGPGLEARLVVVSWASPLPLSGAGTPDYFRSVRLAHQTRLIEPLNSTELCHNPTNIIQSGAAE